jgi:hypothetical protein
VDAVREAGGEIFAVTSEPQSLARNAQDDWETGFEHVGDPHQEILAQCSDRGWLSLFTNDWGDDLVAGDLDWVSHPKGYFQPGVLALTSEARILYRWRCRPTRQNVGGAIVRPTAPHVWNSVRAALAESADAPDVPHDDNPEYDAKPVPWPLFVSMLFANGWFMRPVPFYQRVDGPTSRERQQRAMRRIPFFFAGWVAAFVFLPLWIPTVALVGWIAKITPGVRIVKARFQEVAPGERLA